MDRVVMVAGYAKVPEKTAVRSLYDYLTLGALVDIDTHRVVESTATMATAVAMKWVTSLLDGQYVFEQPPNFVTVVERDYWAEAGRALCQAYRDLVRRYEIGLKDRYGMEAPAEWTSIPSRPH